MRSCKPFLGRAWGACPMEQGSRRVRSHGARQGYTWCANGARCGAQGTHGARSGAQMPQWHPKRVHERQNLAEKRRFMTLVYMFCAAGGCTDMCSRHISPKCGRSGAPHAPHAHERAQRCSPKPAAAPTQPQQGRKRRRPRLFVFRNPQRAARGHRNTKRRGLRREQTTYATLTIQPSGPSISPAWMPVSVSRSFCMTGPT